MFTRRTILVGAGLVLITFTGLLLWSSRPVPPPFEIPAPNGYRLLLESARSLKGGPPSSFSNREDYVRLNAEAFQLFRRALDYPAEAPDSFYVGPNALTALPDSMQLAGALLARAKLAEDQTNYTAAVAGYLDVLRLGQRISRGPLLCLLHGVSIENSGLKELARVLPDLPPDQAASARKELAALQSGRITFSEVIRREQYYARRNATGLQLLFAPFLGTRAAVTRAGEKDRAVLNSYQALIGARAN